jgi:hypothetical protein
MTNTLKVRGQYVIGLYAASMRRARKKILTRELFLCVAGVTFRYAAPEVMGETAGFGVNFDRLDPALS